MLELESVGIYTIYGNSTKVDISRYTLFALAYSSLFRFRLRPGKWLREIWMERIVELFGADSCPPVNRALNSQLFLQSGSSGCWVFVFLHKALNVTQIICKIRLENANLMHKFHIQMAGDKRAAHNLRCAVPFIRQSKWRPTGTSAVN